MKNTDIKYITSTAYEMNANAEFLGINQEQIDDAIDMLSNLGVPEHKAYAGIDSVCTFLRKGHDGLFKNGGQILEAVQDNLKKPESDDGGFINTLRRLRESVEYIEPFGVKHTGRVAAAHAIILLTTGQ